MKIAIVANSAWAAYNFRLNLAKSIVEDGDEVIFIIPFDEKYSNKLKENFKCYNLFIAPKSLNPFRDIKTFASLYRIYNKSKPDLLCHFTVKLNIYGSMAAWFSSIPSIANITGLGKVFIEKSLVTSLVKFLYRISLSLSSKVFFQNKEDLNLFLEQKIINKSSFELIPGSGVDLEKFKFNPCEYNNSKFVFLMISRILKDKGIYEYIDAIKIIKNMHYDTKIEFQLLGEIQEDGKSSIKLSELNQWIKDDLINYLVVSDHVQNKILESNCVVLPSYREGMPRSILEALASGRPAIVSDVPGSREIIEHNKNGFLCKVRSPEDLAEKMISMIELPYKTIMNFSKEGRKKIEKDFDEKIVIKAYLNSINSILSNEKNI